MDGDATLSACTAPIITATAQFGPGANSTSTPSTTTIGSALDVICLSSDSSCSDQTVRGQLSDFYSACTPELTSNPNADVIRTYDVLYALIPFKQALCTKDSNGKYCATEITSPSSSNSNSQVDLVVTSGDSTFSSVKQFLWSSAGVAKRATAQTAAIIPNITTYRDSNLLFFFLEPDTPSATLCTTCSRSVMLSYISFETSVPYAPGLSSSPLMGGQSALYNAMTSTCGATFFTGSVQAAGGLGSGLLGNKMPTSAAQKLVCQSFAGLVAGAAALAAFVF